MNITDEEKQALCIASYALIEDELYNMCTVGDGLPCTLGEIYEKAVATGDCDVSKLGEYINSGSGVDLSDWEIVDYRDANEKNGFFGMVLRDPDSGDLAIVIRGSETFWEYDEKLEQAYLDWGETDLGLLKDVPTPQQLEAEAFIKQIAESDYYNSEDCPNLVPIGHSLGGNLVTHLTITAINYGIDPDRIECCYSLDGQGFPDEYLEKYATEISIMGSKIIHYRWSIVGNLLNPIPGATEIFLDSNLGNNLKEIFLGYIAMEHDMHSLRLENGQFVKGELSWWEFCIGQASRGLDHLPASYGSTVAEVLIFFLVSAVWMWDEEIIIDKDGKLTPSTKLAIGTLFLITAPAGIAVIISVIFVVLIMGVVYLETLYAYEMLYAIGCSLVEQIGEISQWSQEEMAEIKEFLGYVLQDLAGLMQHTANYGYSYVQNHTQIRVDTYKLREYASRLEAVNRMLADIDQRLDRLYWKTKWTDLGTLLQADLLVRESSRLKNCMDYLNETADSFELAEENILRAFES